MLTSAGRHTSQSHIQTDVVAVRQESTLVSIAPAPEARELTHMQHISDTTDQTERAQPNQFLWTSKRW